VDLGLEGKVALVAGGSSGIGLAIAKELAGEGAHVAIGARDPARLAAAKAELERTAPGRIHATGVDLTDAEATRRWVDGVAARFGTLQIVVASTPTPLAGPARAFTAADYRKALDDVFHPAVGLALAALPHLEAAGWGRLLFITSETVCRPVTGLALSAISRVGIVRFAQALAAETGRLGITVNVLAPGGTHTPLVERLAEKHASGRDLAQVLRDMGTGNALGRLARPEELAAVAAFLASERASFVTGTVQLVDGGASVTGRPEYGLETSGKSVLG
jgi:3-oxoacyl-[acyl-carrier protein] reductase